MVFTSAIVLGGAGGIGKEICVQLIGRGLQVNSMKKIPGQEEKTLVSASVSRASLK